MASLGVTWSSGAAWTCLAILSGCTPAARTDRRAAACANAQCAEHQPAAVPSSAYVAIAPPEPQATIETHSRPRIDPLDRVGCQFSLKDWYATGHSLKLYLGPDAEPWGHVTDYAAMPVTVQLKDGWSPGRVKIRHDKIELFAITYVSDVHLYPQTLHVINKFFVPALKTRLVPEQITDDGQVRITPSVDGWIAPRRPLVSEWRCVELGLQPGGIGTYVDGVAAIGRRLLPAGVHVSVAAIPTGKAVATLTPRADLYVDLLEQRGGLSKVRWRTQQGVFFGWVRGAKTPKKKALVLGALGALGGASARSAPKPRSKAHTVQCKVPVPLVVLQRGVARTVGTVGSGRSFEPSVLQGGLVAIHLTDFPIELTDGGFYTVAELLPKHCHSVSVPSK